LLLNEAAQSKLGCLKGSFDKARKRLWRIGTSPWTRRVTHGGPGKAVRAYLIVSQ